METKICPKCNRELELSEFPYKTKWICKDCYKIYHRECYLKNRDRIIK